MVKQLFKINGKISQWQARPLPGPLPRGAGEPSAAALWQYHSGFTPCLTTQSKAATIQRGINAEAQRRREIRGQTELVCWQTPQKLLSHFPPLRLCASALNFHFLVTAKAGPATAMSEAARTMDTLFLSAGERAGERAAVITNCRICFGNALKSRLSLAPMRTKAQNARVTEDLEINWPVAPVGWALGRREVHVWATPLRPAPECVAAYTNTLSPDEKKRAARYLFERDQRRFTAGRGALRAILSRYLCCPPEQINFDYSERGKPSLATTAGKSALHFNLAHSDELALLAVTKIGSVGVDVEKLRPMKDAEAIAERFFSTRETAQLKTLPKNQKDVGFFNLWTRKEAWLKATGQGICDSLNKVEVSLLPDEPARLLSLFDDAQAAADWTLQELNPAHGFKAALALCARDLELRCWSWPAPTDSIPFTAE